MITTTLEHLEKHLRDLLGAAQNEGVLVTQEGKPMAVLVGLGTMDEEDIGYAMSPKFWKMIEEARRSPTVPWDEAKKRLFSEEA